MANLPEAYQTRMRAQLGETGFAAYLAAMDEPPKRALRVNTLKTSAAAFAALCGGSLVPTGLIPEGFLFDESLAVGRHPLHAAGLCYAQEAAAQLPASLLGARPGETVLDLCAAPGGKTTQLAAAMENTGLLVANEPVRARAETLCGNLERLGVANALVVCMQPDALADALGVCFDRVLVDAPCSGEGMFRKDEAAARDWSPEHVRACAVRQRRILAAAARLCKPGGTLVYSTCTFSREENEDAIASFITDNPAFSLIETRRLYPHTSPGEGQFAAVLTRRAGPDAACAFLPPEPERVPALESFWRETLITAPPAALALGDGRVFLPPERMPREQKGLRILRAGVFAGEVKNGRFLPGHALAMALPERAFRRTAALEGEDLTRFLAGEAIPCDPALSGWCAAAVSGHPVGWGKAVDGTLKNHIPKGLRIR